jgi:hypothetical protein
VAVPCPADTPNSDNIDITDSGNRLNVKLKAGASRELPW